MEIYKNIVLSQIPRVLSLMDRNKDSDTYGCFDRPYWHYKTIDFPNSRLQEGILLLALLYKNNFKGNLYYNKNKVLEWCKASINFWSKIQDKDGSFSEVYPHEHSFIATSFTAYAITEAMLMLKLKPNKAVEKAGNWLIRNENLLVSNQMAASVAALNNIYLLTNKTKYKIASRKKLNKLMNLKKDNYFLEYKGYDFGYLSICLGYLHDYFLKTKDESIKNSIEKANNFILKHLDKDGNYDNRKTSRGTQYLYIKGLDGRIRNKHMNGLKGNKIINPSWMDDRFFIPLLIDYLQAYLERKK